MVWLDPVRVSVTITVAFGSGAPVAELTCP